MYGIELMVKEHENILKLLDVIQKACLQLVEGGELKDDDFRQMLAFARNYADKHHHGKEEQILFRDMLRDLGKIGTNLVRHGMLVEHDLGRLHLMDLEAALDRYKETKESIEKVHIIAGAMGYATLLRRHIEKEDELVYTYAEKNLSKEVLAIADEEIHKFEEDASQQGIQEKYLLILNQLVEKYK